MHASHAHTVRPAAVAGLFYPAERERLARELDALLRAAPPARDAAPKALIAPHAGYVYSGAVAASAYALLAPARETITRVVLLGPTHRVAVRGLALPDAAAFETPLGAVPLDAVAIEKLRACPNVVASAEAHALEHALEVHLPFLQTALRAFSVVPLAVGDATPDEVAAVLDVLWGGPETLIVVSSDLSHYLPYDVAVGVDRATCEAILAGSADLDHGQACGATPLGGLALAARRHGLAPELLDLRNSGDTAGDKSRVVGYAAFAYYGRP